MPYPALMVKVWGDYACFTRPEAHVERVSYPVMTPSAARGVLEAIFWHRYAFTWRVKAIRVLRPPRHFSILRNEVKEKMSVDRDFLDIGEHRTQRYTLGLRDVAYLIEADVEVPPHERQNPAKYREQFRRYVQRGQCYHRPYLGCREFAAHFAEPDGSEVPTKEWSCAGEMPLGRMLLDIEYHADGRREAHFFDAMLRDGVLEVPPVPFNVQAPKGGGT